MKKLINRVILTCAALFLFFSFLSQYSFAQNKIEDATTSPDYKKFKVGLGIGYATFGGNNDYKHGLIITLEPSCRVSSNLALSLRFEGVARFNFEGTDLSFKSYTINSQYYFSANKFRPFVGAGLGLYIFSYRSETLFGFYPRIGFDLGHLSMSMDYNLIPGSIPGNEGHSVEDTNHYFGIRIGGFFGGGKN